MGYSSKADYGELRKLQRRMITLETTRVEGGFFEEDRYGAENDFLQVAQVAWWNERGIGVPRREFMTPAFLSSENYSWYANFISQAVEAAMMGQPITPVLKRLGEEIKGVIEVNIDDYPGNNSRAWVAVKGFDDPLLYTGKMLSSVKYKIKRG